MKEINVRYKEVRDISGDAQNGPHCIMENDTRGCVFGTSFEPSSEAFERPIFPRNLRLAPHFQVECSRINTAIVAELTISTIPKRWRCFIRAGAGEDITLPMMQ